jgi:large subunit ribosomal protein L18e
MNRVIENDEVNKWLEVLSSAKKTEKHAKVSAAILKFVSVPKRKRVNVNLDKLSKYANEGESVIVPGKLLGNGKITKKLHVSAVEFSEQALTKLKESGCKVVDIKEMIKKEGIRIIV